jgi:hypothetical protein
MVGYRTKLALLLPLVVECATITIATIELLLHGKSKIMLMVNPYSLGFVAEQINRLFH